jgi:hypothetical protein
VPADYDKIRAENITRYGTDTRVLDLLGQLYSDRTHFIFELIQNAEDAAATELAFELFDDRLEVRHDGRPFTEADVRAICGVGNSAKSAELTAIGAFGIGFTSVYAYTQTPRVHSPGEHFRIDNYVRPVAISADGRPDETLFIFPFDRDDLSPAAATAEISAALAGLGPGTLLFLRNIERVRVSGRQVPAAALERAVVPERTVVPDRAAGPERAAGPGAPRRLVRIRRSSDGSTAEWLVWHRDVGAAGLPGQRVEIAFPVHQGLTGPRLVPSPESPLVVFFPTEKETFLGFLTQGPYRTTPARDNVPEHDPWNQFLVRETAALLTDVLADLRDEGLLTADVLRAMPVEAARFVPGTMFRGLFDSVREALAGGPLIPAAGGGYGAADELALTRDAGLRGLLSAGQLGALDEAGRRSAFAHESIADDGTPLWRYLREEIGVAEVTPESFVASLTGEFLTAQPDAWIRRLYVFLHQHLALCRAPEQPGSQAGPARSKPIIRLEDGSQVAPFDSGGRPAVYLPHPAGPAGPASPASPANPASPDGQARPDGRGTGLPTVRRAIARFADARNFLMALQLSEPDLVTEVLDSILPRYADLAVEHLDAARHDADLESVALALAEAPPAGRQQIVAMLQQTAFLIGENSATGEQRLMPPASLYQRTPELEIYFDENPDAWFAWDGYGPWLTQLREMGVRDAVAVRARRPDARGHVVITQEFARQERGLNGFDPDGSIDGLELALRHPGHRRAEYIWNLLLVPNRDLLAGVVERSARPEFADASRDDLKSAAGAAAAAAAWLPGQDGTFHRPADLQLDDLPPQFKRDDAVAAALDMVHPAVAEAGRQLGLRPSLLRGLSAHRDLVALVERELRARAASGQAPAPAATSSQDPDQDPQPGQAAEDDHAAGSLAAWLRGGSPEVITGSGSD